MVIIRLDRGGTRNKPFYKIIATDSRTKRGGKPLEYLGYWHPAKELVKIEKEKIAAWVEKGAQVSGAVNSLLEGKGKTGKKVKKS